MEIFIHMTILCQNQEDLHILDKIVSINAYNVTQNE